ncbi:hypothetical protein A1OE_575 [Candidatus Endolissoclinum faulkneri L2]|uniref:Uncharacterized protein n=1 Tax=Candidatus Endolissoclinum faulkneri L2 TaxID=1193729 RepID=K7ZCP0_9PROT|nr:hypothetical protein A1OE_575 [Candidatus Endolissoclinum faulkneri L2]
MLYYLLYYAKLFYLFKISQINCLKHSKIYANLFLTKGTSFNI